MTTSAQRSLRVLIIEDDGIISMLLAELLAELGHTVCAIAATEADAVAAATRERPELMIVDMRLGRGTGISAVEEIFRTGPVAHVFLSGAPDAVQALRPDAVMVKKPFRQAELVRAIELALAAHAVS